MFSICNAGRRSVSACLIGVATTFSAIAGNGVDHDANRPHEHPAWADHSPSTSSDGTSSLRDFVARAWQRSPLARRAEGRVLEAQASEAASQAWWSGAPSLSLSHRDDRAGAKRGAREQEWGLSAPLWAPGQRQATLDAAQAHALQAQAELAQVRWSLAGQVRDAFWQARLAEQQEGQAHGHHAALKALQADVLRRVKAGDMARADALLIEQEVIAAEARWHTAQLQHTEALHRWHLLTGAMQLPQVDTPTVPLATPTASRPDWRVALDQHPDMVSAQAALERARREVHRAERSGKQAPEVGMNMRWQRNEWGQSSDRSLGVMVRWPLGSDPVAKVKIAEADTELALAQATLTQQRDRVEHELLETFEALQVQRRQAVGSARRARLAQERLALIRTAFELGDISLTEHLRAAALATEAQTELARDLASLGLAQARHEQAQGILP